jgi:hypothetical protein
MGEGGEMTQALCAHMTKKKSFNKKKKWNSLLLVCDRSLATISAIMFFVYFRRSTWYGATLGSPKLVN